LVGSTSIADLLRLALERLEREGDEASSARSGGRRSDGRDAIAVAITTVWRSGDTSAPSASSGHSIGDTADPLTLQCAGLDATTPEVIRGFVAEEF